MCHNIFATKSSMKINLIKESCIECGRKAKWGITFLATQKPAFFAGCVRPVYFFK